MTFTHLTISVLVVAVIALMYRLYDLKQRFASLREALCDQGRFYEAQLQAAERARLQAFEEGRLSVLSAKLDADTIPTRKG